jgi:ribosomal protein S18 acetylase RimI-like enzyme
VGPAARGALGSAAGAVAPARDPRPSGLAYVDDETPQLGIALFPEFQRRGHGEVLMRAALEAARAHGYRKVSLTVHPLNPAIPLYERCGFRHVEDRRTYHLMVCAL